MLQVHNFEGKGRGIVTTRHFCKGEFVVEYAGELIDMCEAKEREKSYAQDQNTGCYMYYFKYRNSQYWWVENVLTAVRNCVRQVEHLFCH